MTNFPRVLLVTSTAFNHESGGGVTLSNLFGGWPIDRIACAHADTIAPSTDVCREYFQLGESELGRVWPFAAIGRGPRDRARFSPKLKTWINRFAPEVVYTFLGSRGYVRLVRSIVEECRLPVVVHMMDDWPMVIYGENTLGRRWRRALDTELKAIFRTAAAALAISPAMATEYETRYGRRFESFSNAADPDRWALRREWESASPPRLVYVGSVLPEAQLESLVAICEASARVRHRNRDVQVIIAGPSANTDVVKTRLGTLPNVRLERAPTEEDMPTTLASADLLLLPVNFDERTIRYLGLSHPTKLPAYMMSGTPIFMHGPVAVDMVGRALSEGWAFVASNQGADQLASALQEAVSNTSRRRTIGQLAQHMAREQHDLARVRSAFQCAIADAARLSASRGRGS